MSVARIAIPKTAAAGEIIEIKTIVQHPMETGYRRDNNGAAIPRNIVKKMLVTYNGAEVFRMDLFPGVAANPYVGFKTIATKTGEFVFTWEDDRGQKIVERAQIVVG